MVETITPVVHGGRTRRWAVALALHTAGAGIAAAAFGAALGGSGGALGAPWGAAGIVAVGALAVLYLAREALGVRVPVPQLRRQVPDWWRTFFGFEPAALLYGMGLGIGFLTYLRHGTLVVVAAAAFASGRPAAGAVMLAPFGVARGVSAIVAARARTHEDGTALVGRLARSASWVGWRVAHAVVLVAVTGAAAVIVARAGDFGDAGGVAAAVLAVVFAWAAVSKLARPRAWRRSLASYRLGAPLERSATVAIPLVELGIAALPLVGLPTVAGCAALGVLIAFCVAIVLARVRAGRDLDCACFGGARLRDYRALLARNALLALVAVVAWRDGRDEWIGEGLGAPRGDDLVPAVLVALGLAMGAWVVSTTIRTVRRGAVR
jgi:hypothetical protein